MNAEYGDITRTRPEARRVKTCGATASAIPSLLLCVTPAQPDVNWCPITSPPRIATMSPRNTPSPYSLPGLNAGVRP